MQPWIQWSVCVGLGCWGVVTPIQASTEPSLAAYLDCVEIFTETDADLMRVTTLFCGDDERLSTDLEARQYVFGAVSKTTRAVDYQIQLMIRSDQPLDPKALVVDGQESPVDFRTESRPCLDRAVCGYETAVSFSVKVLLIDGAMEALVANGEREWWYEIELSNGAIVPFVFQVDELRAVHYLTQGLMISVPEYRGDHPSLTGI